jgi:hypothetical protein
MAHPGGRPTKRTAAVMAQIAEAISYGLTDQEAAAIAGISRDTISKWKSIPEFAEIIEGAVAERKLFRLRAIEEGGKSWTSMAWLLERSEPMRFGRPEIQLQMTNVTNNLNLMASAELSRQKMLDPAWGMQGAAKVLKLDDVKEIQS